VGIYRYGFNGKENDNEIKGEGNQQDYGMRVYDPRIGKFLSVDPLTQSYPWYTPYQFAGNTPIQAVDLDGLEEYMKQVEFTLKRFAEVKIAHAKEVEAKYIAATVGAVTPQRSNAAENWNNWNSKRAWYNPVGLLSKLAYGTANDAKIAYTTAVDGKNHARGLDNVGVTGYKERIGAGLNTLGSLVMLGVNAEVRAAEAIIKSGGGEIVTTGYNNVEKHLGKRMAEGYQFKNKDDLIKYGENFFKREGNNIQQFKDEKGFIHRIDNLTQEYGVVEPEGNIMTVFKVQPKPNSSYSNASEYLKEQLEKYGSSKK
jgi:RHS repeat-associated protein